MRGHAHAHQRPAGGDGIGHGAGARQQQRQRARPESVHQPARAGGNFFDQAEEHGIGGIERRDMDDDRIPGGALLGGEDALDGGADRGRWPRAVDGLSGQRHEAAGAQNGDGAVERFDGGRCFELEGIDLQPQGVHRSF